MAGPRRRRGARKYTQQPAFFESRRVRGTATLVEVSYSGARLQGNCAVPEVGEPLHLLIWPANHAEPFEIAGRVVGLRKDGFAVEYEEPGQAVCQAIDALEPADAPRRGETTGPSGDGR